MSYLVFSDASVRWGKAAAAVQVHGPDGLIVAKSSLLPVTKTVQAEILGYCLGLSLTSEGSRVSLYYDINDLPLLLANESSVSYGSRMTNELSVLRRLMAPRSVSIYRVNPGDARYRQCHRAARRELRRHFKAATNGGDGVRFGGFNY